MSFENIKKPIQSEDRENQIEEVKRRLRMLQLEYVDNYTKNNGGDFVDNLEKLLKLKDYLKIEYKRRKKIKTKDHDNDINDELKKAVEDVFGVIYKIVDTKDFDWKEQIVRTIEEAPDEWGERPETEEVELKSFQGVYHQKFELRRYENQEVIQEIIEREDLNEFDTAIEIHFDSLFKSGEALSKEKYVEFINSLESLAVKIKKECPETTFVFGSSWLFDKKSLLKRLGFSSIDQELGVESFATWYQFLDQKGQINEKKVSQFQETGELPAKCRLAYMNIEDFLKKYLPDEEKKDEVLLKRIDKNWEQDRKIILKEFKDFVLKWDDYSEAEIEEGLKKRSMFWQKLIDFGIKDDLLNVLLKIKKEGLRFEEGEKKYEQEFNDIGAVIRNNDKEIKYTYNTIDFN